MMVVKLVFGIFGMQAYWNILLVSLSLFLFICIVYANNYHVQVMKYKLMLNKNTGM